MSGHRSASAVPNPTSLGLTEPNEKGRQYQHGTLSGYTAGRCRCDYCRVAFASYRAKRRAQGKDNPHTPRVRETDGHIPRDWFRRTIWTSGMHGRRPGLHAHYARPTPCSCLLAASRGADIQIVKERLGHATIATTERYLHTLPDADETALKALDAIRNRGL